jgi:hypothetical protein
MLVDGNERAHPVTNLSVWDETRLGRRVCKTGVTTGKTCGKIQDKHYSPSYVPQSGRFLKTDGCLQPGDSGGAAFRNNRAYGIVSGMKKDTKCKHPDFYSLLGHIEYVTNALNVTIVKEG